MADSTLDEIIKQKRINRFNTGNQQKKNIIQKKAGVQGKMLNKKQGRLYKEVQKDLGISTLKKPVSLSTDARNKIIHKQRTKFKDARDRLAQIAKQGDARDKLNKLRKTKPGDKVVPQQKKTTVVKKKNVNMPRQAFRAGQTQQGQTRMKGAAVIRTVAGADPLRKKRVFVRGRTGVVKNAATVVTRGRQRQGGRSHPNPGVITIRNNNANVYDNAFDVVDYRQELQLAPRAQPFSGGMGVPTPIDAVMTMREPVIRSRPVQEIYYEPEVRPSRLRITAANHDYRVSGQQYVDEYEPQAWDPPTVRVPQRKREYYEPSEYQVYPKKIAPVAAPVVQAEPGTKVVVSNLHLCVSVEDMEELFGTIGPVHSVRMLRQGVAEAMFVNQDDAYRSVDLFNNRQLDGQPMKVMVVRKKTQVTSSVQARSVLRNARGRSGYYV